MKCSNAVIKNAQKVQQKDTILAQWAQMHQVKEVMRTALPTRMATQLLADGKHVCLYKTGYNRLNNN